MLFGLPKKSPMNFMHEISPCGNNMEQLKKYNPQKQEKMAKKTNITCLQVPHPHGGYIVNNDQYHSIPIT